MAAASVAAPAEPDAPGAAPQNTADQLLPARVGLPVARALFRGEADKVAVPATWASAHAVFWQHPTPLCAAASIAALTWQRLQLAPLTPVAALAALLGAALWVAQEWAIHAYLFHGPLDWFGRRVHAAHHRAPYHHISLDGPELAAPVILVATGALWAALGPALGLCAAIGYVGQGLFYQFTHYAVHTRAAPKSRFWRRVRQHHMQHHCRNENYWLGFTLPAVDSWLGTNPAAGAVPMTPLARESVRRKQQPATAASSGAVPGTDGTGQCRQI